MNNDDPSSGPHSGLDVAIDRAVRQMMQVDPRPGLRRRVLADITRGPSRRAGFFPGFAIAGGILAMLVVVVFVVRRDAPAPPGATSAPATATTARVEPAPIATPSAAVPPTAPPTPGAAGTAPRPARGAHSEPIRMPRIGNVFGSRGSGVTATDTGRAQPDTVFASTRDGRGAAATSTAAGRGVDRLPANAAGSVAQGQSPAGGSTAAGSATPAAQTVNIKLELTITDRREGVTPRPHTVTMLLQDRENGHLRTDAEQKNSKLSVDARPEILANGRIRVVLTLEYRPETTGGNSVRPPTLTQTLTAILEDGKPLVISRSADQSASRAAVTVGLQATVLR
jgi:hypothetical protein